MENQKWKNISGSVKSFYLPDPLTRNQCQLRIGPKHWPNQDGFVEPTKGEHPCHRPKNKRKNILSFTNYSHYHYLSYQIFIKNYLNLKHELGNCFLTKSIDPTQLLLFLWRFILFLTTSLSFILPRFLS